MGTADRSTGRPRRGRGGSAIEELVRPGHVIEIERRIAASPQTVFSYLVEPAKFITWMGTGAEFDPRPGGAFRLEVDPGNIAIGEYVEVDPPHRVSFTFGWIGHPTVPPGSTTVEITLSPDGSGTLLRLRHLGMPDEEARRMHADGWSLYLGQLAALLAPPGG